MTKLIKLQSRIKGFNNAIARYPLTALFLLAAAVVNAIDISNSGSQNVYLKYLLCFIVGAFVSAVFQVIYERFGAKSSSRWLLLLAALIITLGYYLIIRNVPELGLELRVRTAVSLFALLMAFIWVPAIKSRVSFNASFMAVFKALFIALFFAAVIWGGVSLILAAIDKLLLALPDTAYAHLRNLIFILFAPLYFLSLIPVYPGRLPESIKADAEENLARATSCPKFLAILISYILIPLIAVFTAILLIYIMLNLGGRFWTDNLLEPMLVAYAVTVILVYILASGLENKFAFWFRKVFPKLLIPIVIFQIIASGLSLAETGLTFGRYYVILFGIFAVLAGLVLSLVPVSKNGIVAALIIIFSVFSLIPPVDAFSLSRHDQISRLQTVLLKNDMLKDNVIQPKASISDSDKKIITGSISYLATMGYLNRLAWLPPNFNSYNDFDKTFGFKAYSEANKSAQPVYVNLNQETGLAISGYDAFISTHIAQAGSHDNQYGSQNIYTFTKMGKSYTLQKYITASQYALKVIGANSQGVISFATKDIFKRYSGFDLNKNSIDLQEATFVKENSKAKLMIVVQNLNMDDTNVSPYYGADVYVFIKIK